MIRLAIALQRIPFLRSREQLLLLEILSSSEDLRRIGAQELLGMVGRRYRGQQIDAEALLEQVDRDLALMPELGVYPVHIWSSEYPALLREIDDPPIVLYVRGRIPTRPCISVVGTRQPSTEGRHAAYRLGFELVKLGYSVVSGLALGIDAESHAGALDGGGITAAILGSGVDTVAPRCNAHLAARMLAQEGALLSEFPLHTPPAKYRYPQRNRIIAGLSAVTVVVEAPRGSGALITAEFALESREVMVHRVGCESSMGDGCRELVCCGARVLDRAGQLLPPAVASESSIKTGGRN